MSNSTPPKVKRFPAEKQRRLDALLEKNADGSLSTKEKANLDSLVAEAEQVMVDNAQRLAEFSRNLSPQPPVSAVPVTVWVNPQLAQ